MLAQSHLVLADNDPRTRTPAVIETEGDRIPPKHTTLRELTARASEYDGKRVSVIGFYHSEFEGSELRLRKKSDESQNVWCEMISSFAPKDVEFKQDSWACIEGTFLKGPSGHFGMWPGEITRVTRFELQSTPTFSDGQ